MKLQAAAPDGTTVSIDTDKHVPDAEMCVAQDGPDEQWCALCTLPYGHPGPWHIADTASEIIAVWPVEAVQ